MSVLEEAADIAARREYQHDLIIADLYYMSVLVGDQEAAQQIWQEAKAREEQSLLDLLLRTRVQALRVQQENA